jgi:hypothetical protein
MCVTRAGHCADAVAPTESTTAIVAPTEPHVERPSSEIYVIGTQDQFAGLREVIGHTRIGPVTAQWSRLERFAPEALLSASGVVGVDVRCWIDLSVAEQASLYFADRSSERFLVRELPLSKRLTELEKETLAQVVEMSIVALIGDATLGLSRARVQALLLGRSPQAPPPPPVLAPMPPPAAPRVRWQQVLGAYYQLESHSPQIPWVHAPGVEIGIARKSPTTKVTLALRVGYQLPEAYRTDLAGLRLSALRLRSHLAFDMALDAGNSHNGQDAPYFGVLLSAGAHLLFAEPLAGNAAERVNLAPQTSLFVPTIGAGCRATQAFGSWALSLGFQADIDLESVSYDVEQNGERIPVVKGHSVRPSVVLEIGWL